MRTVIIFSDIHANCAALRAVLSDIALDGTDEIFCLGDVVGYGPDPNGAVDLVRESNIPTLMGNNDDGIGFERGGCGSFYPDEQAKRIAAASYEFTVRSLTQERRAFLRGFPYERRLNIEGASLRLVHGSPHSVREYLLPGRDDRLLERLAEEQTRDGVDVLIFGHTHIPWHRVVAGVLFLNVGSVGMPSDGDPRAAYTMLRVEAGQVTDIENIRVAYDIEETAGGIIAAGLPVALADLIRLGGQRL